LAYWELWKVDESIADGIGLLSRIKDFKKTNTLMFSFIKLLYTVPEFSNFLMSLGIDSKESIHPAYVAWRAGATTLFVVPAHHTT